MAKISYQTFDGLLPRLSPRLLPEDAAQVARNCRLKAGNLEPLKGLGTATVASVASGAKTIYPWRYRDTGHTVDQIEWLGFTHETGVVRSPVHGDEYWRIYHTDSAGVLQCRHRKSAATVTRKAGLAAPAAPSLSVRAVLDAETLRALPNTYAEVFAVYSNLGLSPVSVENVPCPLENVRMNDDGTVIFDFKVPEISVGRFVFSQSLAFSYGGLGCFISKVVINNVVAWQSSGVLPVTVTDGATPPVTLGTLTYDKLWTWNISSSLRVNHLSSTDPLVTRFSTDPIIYGGTAACKFQVAHGAAFASEQDVYYVQSVVDDLGEESPASEVSARIHVEPGQAVVLAAVTLASPLQKRRIYRTATGEVPEHDDFYYCGENNGAQYVDKTEGAALGEVLPRIENPPAKMAGLVALPGGVLAAFNARDVFLSEPFLPYSWPEKYRLTVADEVVALAVGDRDLYVLTRSGPWVVSGAEPETMAEARIPLDQGCASSRAVATSGGRVLYASPDGIVALAGGQAVVITHEHATWREWQTYNPSSMVFAAHDGALVISMNGTGGLIWEQAETRPDALTVHTLDYGAVFHDAETDTLYVAVGTAVKAWGAGAALTLRWRGREQVAPVPIHFAAARVVAAAYPVTVRLYAEGVLKATATLSAELSARLPRLRPERVWSVEIDSAAAVHELSVATSVGELRK